MLLARSCKAFANHHPATCPSPSPEGKCSVPPFFLLFFGGKHFFLFLLLSPPMIPDVVQYCYVLHQGMNKILPKTPIKFPSCSTVSIAICLPMLSMRQLTEYILDFQAIWFSYHRLSELCEE